MDRLPRHPEAVQFNKYHGEGSARYFAYEPNCPHEHDPTDHPPLFLADGVVIGTVRIGIRPEGWAGVPIGRHRHPMARPAVRAAPCWKWRSVTRAPAAPA